MCGKNGSVARRTFPNAATSLTLALGVAAAVCCAGCGGTASGGAGDESAVPLADPLGNGLRVHQVVGPATWSNPLDRDSLSCKLPRAMQVSITGATVIAVDRFDETGDGALGNIYIEDALPDPVPFSGVTVFAPSFTPPDLRLFAGDVADLLGNYEEFPGPSGSPFSFCHTLPEIGGAMTFRFDTHPVVPKLIPITDLRSYDTARQWLGMLVRVENIKLAATGATDKKGRCSIALDVGSGITVADQPKLSNELFNVDCTPTTKLTAGTEVKSLTGVLTYFYSFSLAPRSADDIVL